MVTNMNVMFSQLKGAMLVDRVERKEDHLLVYIREVKGVHGGQYYMMILRFLTNYVSVFLPTVTKRHCHQSCFSIHTGDPSAEPEASCDQDL